MPMKMANPIRDKRKLKRYINHLAAKLKPGAIFESCSYEPSVVTKRSFRPSDIYGSDVEGVSIVTGAGCSCSLFHCGPWPLSKENARARVKHLEKPGASCSDPEYKVFLEAWDSDPYTKKLAKLSKRYFQDEHTNTISGYPRAFDGLPPNIKQGLEAFVEQAQKLQNQGTPKKKRRAILNRTMRALEREAGFSLSTFLYDLIYDENDNQIIAL